MYFTVEGRDMNCEVCEIKLTDNNTIVASVSDGVCQECHTKLKTR